MSKVIIKNNIDSELQVEHKDGEGALIVDTEALRILVANTKRTWQDVSGSRASGVTYTNTTDGDIEIGFRANGATSNAWVDFVADSINVTSEAGFTSGESFGFTATIPKGSTYKVTIGASSTNVKWNELRI